MSTKTKQSKKELVEKMGVAWVAQWSCHAQNESEYLESFGITNKVIDIFSTRKTFENIIEIAQDIYKQKILSLSEKVYISHYNKGGKRRKEFFAGLVPVFTHHKSQLYRDLMNSTEINGLDDPKTKKLVEKWKKYPQYILVGHNPYLEIIKVFNVLVYKNNDGTETIEWDRLLSDGSFKKESAIQ